MKLEAKKLAITAFAIPLLAIMVLFANQSRAVGTALTEGGGIFKAKCATCHGADGSGNTPVGKKLNVRDLRSAEVQSQSDSALVNIIAKGKGKMPPYAKGLGDEKIRQLVVFIRTLRK
ncbi:MAG: cytochrome c [Acidobacteriota bacterium]